MTDKLPPTRPSATPKDDPRRRALRREQAAAEAMQPLGEVPGSLADWYTHVNPDAPFDGGWWTLENGNTAVIGIQVDHPHRARFYIHDLHGDRLAHLDFEGPTGMPDRIACQRVLAAALAAGLVTPLKKI